MGTHLKVVALQVTLLSLVHVPPNLRCVALVIELVFHDRLHVVALAISNPKMVSPRFVNNGLVSTVLCPILFSEPATAN